MTFILPQKDIEIIQIFLLSTNLQEHKSAQSVSQRSLFDPGQQTKDRSNAGDRVGS